MVEVGDEAGKFRSVNKAGDNGDIIGLRNSLDLRVCQLRYAYVVGASGRR